MSMVSASKYAQYGVAVILVLHISMLVVTRSVAEQADFSDQHFEFYSHFAATHGYCSRL